MGVVGHESLVLVLSIILEILICIILPIQLHYRYIYDQCACAAEIGEINELKFKRELTENIITFIRQHY